MIVRAVGLTTEEVLPRGGVPRHGRVAANEWLVITSDRQLRSHVVATIGRHGGVVRDTSAIDEWCRLMPARRRHAFVDLVAADDGFAEGFLARLARPGVTPRPNLLVRGVDGDAAGELLARQAGAIAYLTGRVYAGFLDSLIGEISS